MRDEKIKLICENFLKTVSLRELFNKKEFMYPVAAGVVFIILLMTIRTITPEEGIERKLDLKYYLEMAEASPGINTDVIPPFKYRILLPWLAGLLQNPVAGFYFLMLMGFIVQGAAFILYFRDRYGTESSSLAYVFLLLNAQISVFLIQNPYNVVDLYVSAFTILFLLLLKKGKITWAVTVLLACVFIKENFIIMAAGGLVLLKNREKNTRSVKLLLAGSIVSLIIAVLIRLLIDGSGSGYLMEQVSVHVPEKLNDPVIILKTLIGPALFILPVYLVFADKWIIHVRENKELLVIFLFTFLSTFWGANDARLMTGAGVFYYGFVCMVVNQILNLHDVKESESRMKTGIFIWLMILVNLAAVLITNRNSILWYGENITIQIYIAALAVITAVAIFLKFDITRREKIQVTEKS